MATGPSTTTAPYLVPLNANVTTTSILTVGDSVGGYRMAGIPDGLGAFDNGNGTFTVLMNHELGSKLGAVHAHGATGAFVSKWTVDKSTLAVTAGEDLIKQTLTWDTATASYKAGAVALDRLCSADLPATTAFYNAASGKGYADGRIFMSGEESADGRAFAHFVTGSEAGNSYELARMGNLSFENVVASPHASDKTIVIGLDDSRPGQVYVYVGDKTSTGTALDKAGLTNGKLYGVKVDGAADETRDAAGGFSSAQPNFSMVDFGDVSSLDGKTLQSRSETAGVTEFLRPEDGAWDPNTPGRFYFVTTDRFDTLKPDGAHPEYNQTFTFDQHVTGEDATSRLWQMDFTDPADPSKGGKLTMLLDGNEGQQMLDNMTVTRDGKIILQEDPGNQAYSAKVWQYDIRTDTLIPLAEHDPRLFGTAVRPTAAITRDEESSGVIDVTDLVGTTNGRSYLLTDQIHARNADPALVEGGQLTLMTVRTTSTKAAAAELDYFIA